MRIVEGLAAWLLTALVVFGAVVYYNSKTQPVSEARLKNATAVRTAATEKQLRAEGIQPAGTRTVVRHQTGNAIL